MPACPGAAPPAALLLPGGGGPVLLLAQQSRAQTVVAGSCTGAGAAGTRASPPAHFPVARHHHRVRTLPVLAFCPGEGLQSRPALAYRGPGAPSCLAHAGCSAVAHISCCGTVKEGGSGPGCSHSCTHWGLGLGRVGDRAGHASQWCLNPTRVCIVGPRVPVAGKEPCLGCCWAGLHLGKAALCLGYSLLRFALHPWAPRMGPAPMLQQPARVDEQPCPHSGWSREVTCCLQLEYSLPSSALFLLPASGLMSSPCPSMWLSLAPGAYPALGSSVVLWHVHGPAGALECREECKGRTLSPA